MSRNEDGKKSGKGAYKWADNSVYDGDWYDNNIEGFGEYKWPDNRGYIGEWKENKLHGKGISTMTNGQ